MLTAPYLPTRGDACDPQTCGNGTTEPGATCDDGNTVSNDSCSDSCQIECRAQPTNVCRQPILPLKSSLKIVNKSPDNKDLLKWRWTKGTATALLDFGDPSSIGERASPSASTTR